MLTGRELARVWTVRAAPRVYRRTDLPVVAAAVEPFSEADAGKRIYDAAKPLRAAGISNLAALDAVAAAMRSVVTEPTVKGEVSRQLADLMDPPYLRFCRACNATHLYEMPFRLAALRAGLELEGDTSPPVLRRVPGFKRAAKATRQRWPGSGRRRPGCSARSTCSCRRRTGHCSSMTRRERRPCGRCSVDPAPCLSTARSPACGDRTSQASTSRCSSNRGPSRRVPSEVQSAGRPNDWRRSARCPCPASTSTADRAPRPTDAEPRPRHASRQGRGRATARGVW